MNNSNKTTGRILVIIGLLLHLVVLGGAFITLIIMLLAFTAIGNAPDIAAAAGTVTGAVAHALGLVIYIMPIGFVGLILLAVGIIQGEARERWVFWCSLAAMISWLFLIPIGPLFGLVGLILLLTKKRFFEKPLINTNPH